MGSFVQYFHHKCSAYVGDTQHYVSILCANSVGTFGSHFNLVSFHSQKLIFKSLSFINKILFFSKQVIDWFKLCNKNFIFIDALLIKQQKFSPCEVLLNKVFGLSCKWNYSKFIISVKFQLLITFIMWN